jgi:hypothetical protein
MIKKQHIYNWSITPLLALVLYGCVGGGAAGIPTRKKMPEFTSYDGIESATPFSNHPNTPIQQGNFAFLPTNVDLLLNGTTQGFVAIPLPDQAGDSAAVNLVNSVKPFAIPLLTAWAQQQRHGVMIDLSDHRSGEVHRTDYLLEQPSGFAIPIVVMWDERSGARVTLLKNIVQGIPSVTLSCTSCDNSTGR